MPLSGYVCSATTERAEQFLGERSARQGLLIGIELQPEAGTARRFCEALKDEGVLCKETHETIMRFAPPLIIDQETLEWALACIAKVLHSK